MIAKYLLFLGIGHVLGDFYFQKENLATEKNKKFKGVLKHSIEYLVSAIFAMVPIINIDMLLAALYMSVAHFIIDSIKYVLIKKKILKKSGKVFIGDQVAHVLSILVLAYIMYCWKFEMANYKIIENLQTAFGVDMLMVAKWLLLLLIIHVPSNILIQNVLDGYKPKEVNSELIKVDNKAGRWIGTIERLIMLFFIAIDQYAAMGLVLTAKSIARYDKIAKDEKFAEYYLLGTLLSTVCVVSCKMVMTI